MAEYIHSIETANPDLKLSQQDALALLCRKRQLSKREKILYTRFLSDKGIESRFFAIDNVDDFFTDDNGILIERFQRAVVDLAHQSVAKLFDSNGFSADEIGCLAVSTCTGYLCPGISSYLIEKLKLKNNIAAVDLVGMGCGGALPALRTICGLLREGKSTSGLVTSAEICSAAIVWDDDPEIILSNSIFGDGAASCLVTTKKTEKQLRILDFEFRVHPEFRDILKLTTQNGLLRNVLKPTVPQTAATILNEVLNDMLKRNSIRKSQISAWALHPGGRKVLDTIKSVLGLEEEKLLLSRNVLRHFGNMSSPSVLYVLKEVLSRQFEKGDYIIAASFGAGFSVYAALLQYEE